MKTDNITILQRKILNNILRIPKATPLDIPITRGKKSQKKKKRERAMKDMQEQQNPDESCLHKDKKGGDYININHLIFPPSNP